MTQTRITYANDDNLLAKHRLLEVEALHSRDIPERDTGQKGANSDLFVVAAHRFPGRNVLITPPLYATVARKKSDGPEGGRRLGSQS